MLLGHTLLMASTCNLKIWNKVVKISKLSTDCMPPKLKPLKACDFLNGEMGCKWDWCRLLTTLRIFSMCPPLAS